MPSLTVTERRDGCGDISFGDTGSSFATLGRGGFGIWQPALDPVMRFLGVPDVAALHDLIERTARHPGKA